MANALPLLHILRQPHFYFRYATCFAYAANLRRRGTALAKRANLPAFKGC
jgi:hypothetical protein